MLNRTFPVQGAGLGLRRSMFEELAGQVPAPVNFMEVAPENWIGVGGSFGKQFRALTEQQPFVAHGLSLSIGGPAPLDEAFLQKLKRFIKEHNIRCYTEHLSYSGDDGHLYDLMPIPFTEEAIKYVVKRIQQVQDTLGERIGMENVSYYAAPGKEMEEIEFINAVVEEADCGLLLDVNNIYVNSINHCYDPLEFMRALPGERIMYVHIAGHYEEAPDLVVDTHGADVIDPVWHLLGQTYQHFGVLPTLLERDFNLPPLANMLEEVEIISSLQHKWTEKNKDHRHG